MTYTTATVSDLHRLTQVEIESKKASIPQCVESVELDKTLRYRRWETYMAGSSPSSSLPERVIFVAKEQDTIIGYLAGHHTTRFGLDCELQSVYVLKPSQGQGIGTALLERFAAWMTEHLFRSACVGVAPENPYRAFYLKQGAVAKNPHWLIWEDLPAGISVVS